MSSVRCSVTVRSGVSLAVRAARRLAGVTPPPVPVTAPPVSIPWADLEAELNLDEHYITLGTLLLGMLDP